MIAYKGFDKDLKCRGFQYEIGGEYETDFVELCYWGFHACECPLDVRKYYPPTDGNRYCEVELSGKIDRGKIARDTKIAATRIRIIRELTVDELAEAHRQWVRDHATQAQDGDDRVILTDGNWSILRVGNYDNLSGGDCAILASGDGANLTGGNYAVLTGGDGANLTGGNYAVLTGRDGSNLTGGDNTCLTGGTCARLTGGTCASLTGGDRAILSGGLLAILTGGDGAIATCRGDASVGKKGCAVVRGCGVRVRGGLGSVLVICNATINGEILDWKAVVVDGVDVKADTWYRLEDGELVEC